MLSDWEYERGRTMALLGEMVGLLLRLETLLLLEELLPVSVSCAFVVHVALQVQSTSGSGSLHAVETVNIIVASTVSQAAVGSVPIRSERGYQYRRLWCF